MTAARRRIRTVKKEPRPGSLRARVLLAIRRACAEERAIAYADLARASGVSTGTLRIACQDLCRRGLIAIERRRGHRGHRGRPGHRGHRGRDSELRFIDMKSGVATAWTGFDWGGGRGGPGRGKRGVRACLTCGTDFRSAGIHNRICEACREETADYDASWHQYHGRGEL